ncbi:MAG: 50S ribosomal protein L29 [Candidatus Moranbacteria bacterium GW2011_GWF2_34_56]|nr:MAG: 50S ribosomal protein L29 [Candidatus Moranbacteria bacterium GW2011_GWF1_34_10]KKP65245.1 MAG: 50S ribosomal protein L29 [Candidatus Moranbacteria bacterium GW2011_GWF2_34_56]HBI17500.1 50S ribosomal protein L29 [Candidatus Moranbacteria bacterium]
MKTKDLREKNINELAKDLGEKRIEAQALAFDISVKQAKNNKALRNAKKDIARILTVVREKNNI